MRSTPTPSERSSPDVVTLNPPLQPSLIVGIKEAARLLNKAVPTLRDWLQRGYGPPRIGGTRLVEYRRSDIVAFVDTLATYQSNAALFAAKSEAGAA